MTPRLSRLLVHSRYVLQEYLMMRAPLPILCGVIAGLNFAQAANARADTRHAAGPQFIAAAHDAYGVSLSVTMFVTIILAVVAIMTIDRTTNYYRFFFSKPVNVTRYYLHTYALHGTAACLFLGAGAVAWSGAMPHEPAARAVALCALSFLLIGGVGFGVGALTNLDAAIVPLAFMFAASASGVISDYARGRAPAWLVLVERMLPPARAIHDAAGAIINGRAPAMAAVGPIVLWGAAGWVAGVFILRWRPLAR